ncbi:hypothetical protein ABPG75_012848 [Micractinium tetrahymenae]
MSDPLYQQTKLGGVFTPWQQHRSFRFAQLAAAYLGQPLQLVLLECLRLRHEAAQQWEEGAQRRRAERLEWQRSQRGQQQQQQQHDSGEMAAAPAAQHKRKVVKVKKGSRSWDKVPAGPPPAGKPAAAEEAAAEEQPPPAKRRKQQQEEPAPAAPIPAAEVPAMLAPELQPQAVRRKNKTRSGDGQQPPAMQQEQAAQEQQPAREQTAVPAAVPAATVGAAPGAALDGAQAAGSKKRKTVKQAVAEPAAAAPPVAVPPAGTLPGKGSSGSSAAASVAALLAAGSLPAGGSAGSSPPAGAGLLAAAAGPMLAAPAATAGATATAAAAAPGARPDNARKRWRPEADRELQRLAEDAGHRQALLGSPALDWAAIGRHLAARQGQQSGATARSARLAVAATRAGSRGQQGPQQRRLQRSSSSRCWHPEEMEELMRLGQNAEYRQHVLGTSKNKWQAIGQHFGVRMRAAKSRYFSELDRLASGAPVPRAACIPGLFAGFAECILRSMPERTASTTQVFAALESDTGMFAQLLPQHFVPRKNDKSRPRWKHNLHGNLASHPGIRRVGNVGREALWRLLPEKEWLAEGKPAAKKQAASAPLLGKKS